MALSGVESIDTLPSVECRNINWSLCSTLGVARYVCGPVVHRHLFSSVVAAMLPYWGRSSRSHNKRNPKNRLIVNHRWLPALKDELLPLRPLRNKGNAEGSAGTSWLLRGTCARVLPRVGRVSFAGQSHSLISNIYHLTNSTIVSDGTKIITIYWQYILVACYHTTYAQLMWWVYRL